MRTTAGHRACGICGVRACSRIGYCFWGFLNGLPPRGRRGSDASFCGLWGVAPSVPRERSRRVGIGAASCLKSCGETARVAYLSFSTVGSTGRRKCVDCPPCGGVGEEKAPGLEVDGNFRGMRPSWPRSPNRRRDEFLAWRGRANVLIFPDLNAGNISYKLVQHLGGRGRWDRSWRDWQSPCRICLGDAPMKTLWMRRF